MSGPLRPLLPATAGVKRPGVAPTGSERAKEKVPSACEACRIHKSKCSRERPTCRACVGRKIACVYTAPEARRVRQKYEELRSRRSAQEQLLELMRVLPEHDAVDLLRRVRAGGDAEAIVNTVRDGSLLLQLHLVPETRLRYDLPCSRDMPASLRSSGSPYLESIVYEASIHNTLQQKAHVPAAGDSEFHTLLGSNPHPKYRDEFLRPYHAAVLVEPRLQIINPSDWTTVSKDDHLMRELLTAYFTHEYHLWPVFQKDYFLEDMAKGRVANSKTPCCSSLLVNAVLAYGCYCFRKIPNRFRYWDPQALGYRFLAEAKRIFEMQIINRKYHHLATVQAALIINIVHDTFGLDKIGDTYGLKGWAIAREMRLLEGNEHIQSQEVRDARNFTAWCLFGFDSHIAWQFLRVPVLAGPPKYTLPDPSVNAAWYGEIWLRYPLSETLSPTHYGHIFKCLCDLRIILGELCRASFGTESKIPTEQARSFVGRLMSWYTNLPIPLKPENIVLPAHFLMHLDYQIALMIVCQPFVDDKWGEELSPKDIVSNVERDLNVLLRLYYLRHSFEAPHIYLTAPLTKLGFLSLHGIHDGISRENLHYMQSSLLLALEGLRAQGRNYYITRTVYYIIKSQLRPEESRLLLGAEDPETVSDKVPELESEIQSAWTPAVLNIMEDPSTDELSKLAKRFLTIDSGEQSDSEAGNSSPLGN